MNMFGWIFGKRETAENGGKLPEALRRAGLDEESLRRMDPDDRVAALERAKLDPYDYIYLAC